jgi:hypothetical protein
VEIHDQVAGQLCRPGGGGVRGAPRTRRAAYSMTAKTYRRAPARVQASKKSAARIACAWPRRNAAGIAGRRRPAARHRAARPPATRRRTSGPTPRGDQRNRDRCRDRRGSQLRGPRCRPGRRAPRPSIARPYTSRETALTRAFTGRTAPGIRNRFLEFYTTDAPTGYPRPAAALLTDEDPGAYSGSADLAQVPVVEQAAGDP